MGWTFYNASGQQMRATADKAATQAEMEAGSSTAAYATPGRMKYHPGVAIAWCQIEFDGATLETGDYNVATVTDTGTGNRRISLTNAAGSTETFIAVFGTDIAGGGTRLSQVSGGAVDCLIYNSSDALADGGGNDHFVAFGDFS